MSSLTESEVSRDLPVWKNELLALCEESIRNLPTPATPPEVLDDTREPSLYDFYAELAVLRNEQRSGNRKLSEVLKDFSTVLTDLKDGQKNQPRTSQSGDESGGSLKIARLVIDLLDRIDRIVAAGAAPFTVKPFLIGPATTPARWTKQQEGLRILESHFRPLMTLIGLEYRPVVGRPYDPSIMTAVFCPPDSNLNNLIVTKELTKAYWWRDQNIRPAEVEVGERQA